MGEGVVLILDSPDGIKVTPFKFILLESMSVLSRPAGMVSLLVSEATPCWQLLPSVLVLWRVDIVSDGGCELAEDDDSSFCPRIRLSVGLNVPVGRVATGTGFTSSVVESVTCEREE